MTKKINSKIIDFIEYRELKKGFDINIYLNMDILSFTNIYDKTSMEIDYRFSELIELDEEISRLKRKTSLNNDDNMNYEKCLSLGQYNYERYIFLEEKMKILEEVRNINGWDLIDGFNYDSNEDSISLNDDELDRFFNYDDDDLLF